MGVANILPKRKGAKAALGAAAGGGGGVYFSRRGRRFATLVPRRQSRRRRQHDDDDGGVLWRCVYSTPKYIIRKERKDRHKRVLFPFPKP